MTTSNAPPTKKKKNARKKKRGGRNGPSAASAAAPKPGEEGYLTATQLRNARKRRAKKQRKQSTGGGDGDGPGANGGGRSERAGLAPHGESISTRAAAAGGANVGEDPSMRYAHDPRSAPVVQSAKRYFANLLTPPKPDKPNKPNEGPFRVHLGPTKQWRTVAKLAVRRDPQRSEGVQIGLFLPGTHTVLPVPKCTAHHPSINAAVEVVAATCERVGVEPYDEVTGTGFLRYVAINVERSTGRVQVTLVWNSAPYGAEDDGDDGITRGEGKEGTDEDGGRSMLGRLVEELIRVGGSGSGETAADGTPTTNKRKRRRGRSGNSSGQGEKKDRNENNGPSPCGQFKLHSLWVHHNAAWKHSNAIFDCSGAAADGESSTSAGGSTSCSAWKRFHGSEAIVECLPIKSSSDVAVQQPSPVRLHFPPNVFRQANLDKFADIVSVIRDRLVRYAAERADEEKKNRSQGGGGGDGDGDGDGESSASLPSCVELYGGVGTIGLNIVDLVSTLVSSDENPHNAKCFRDGEAALHHSVRGRATYVAKNATDMVEEEGCLRKGGGGGGGSSSSRAAAAAPEVVIVDPPRKGLDGSVREALTNLPRNRDEGKGPQMLVYVSCGFKAFQRDCDELLRSGLWMIDHAEGHLLFPGSDAIETLAVFVRKSSH